MKLRPDLLSKHSPDGLEIFQLTLDPATHSCHIYPETQIFTPDSQRLVLHSHANPHGGDIRNPLHQYFLCDLSDNGNLTQLTNEPGVAAPVLSPDGKFFYYFVNEWSHTPFRILLKRIELETERCDTIQVIDTHLPGTKAKASYIPALASIRSDGKSIVTHTFLGNGETNPDFGILVFDLETATVELIIRGPSWCNVHSQYTRSTDPEHFRDIMIQENHGCIVDAGGKVAALVQSPGCDIHMIRDDGTNFRTLPWGRDPQEQCRGHQCWRGTSTYAIGSVTTMDGDVEVDSHLMEGQGVAYPDHLGKHTPGAAYNKISRNLHRPQLDHFATNLEGDILICDGLYEDGWRIDMMRLGVPGSGALSDPVYLLHAHADITVNPKNLSHPHPFFSPDGKLAFFNSNETGTLQAYMLRNLPELKKQTVGSLRKPF